MKERSNSQKLRDSLFGIWSNTKTGYEDFDEYYDNAIQTIINNVKNNKDMVNEATGKIKLIKDVQTFSSGFEKREFVLTIQDGKYEQHVKFELLKDDVVKTAKFNVGDEVKVTYNLKGNYYEPNDAYYNSLQAWKIESVAAAPPMDISGTAKPKKAAVVVEDDDDDLPF